MRSDGDFCSREHKNQFRLRRGMDRLQEANKVASLMRRREIPRQIPPAMLLISPAMEPRPAVIGAFRAHSAHAGFASTRPLLYRPKIAAAARYLKSIKGRGQAAPARVAAPAALRFVVQRAPAGCPKLHVATKETLRPSQAGAIHNAAANKGQVLTERPYPALPIPEPPLRIPGGPSPLLRTAARSRGLVPLVVARLNGVGQTQHLGSAPWNTAVRAASLMLSDAIIGHPGLAAAGLRALDSLRNGAENTYRLAEVPFAPSDSTFDYRPMSLHGSLAALPAEPASAPSLVLEEDFTGGLERWSGDTSGWRLDAAGARPMGLAFLQQSLPLADYEFEFLVRVAKGSVTFVFRASNASNYHKITLALGQAGRYELQRSIVIGGAEESCDVVSLPDQFRSGTALTVKACARRNDFSVLVEEETVARWTDGRLPTGGIGFTASKEDRARIYWVRVTALGNANSEAGPSRLPRSLQ
jgi:hypothetical protein